MQPAVGLVGVWKKTLRGSNGIATMVVVAMAGLPGQP